MSAYYNEFDPKAAAWLRELINAGLIADGEVDERSILEVQPDELRGFTQCHFFAGIGGWSLALRYAGWGDDVPVWTGSPPCQPFSVSGKGLGADDERHLAPHFISLVRACRPSVLFGEQVASAAVLGKVSKTAKRSAGKEPDWAWFDDLSDRLEASQYTVGAGDIPAASVGAPNIRQRTFFGAFDNRLAVGGLAYSTGASGPQHERKSWQRRDEVEGNAAIGGGVLSRLDDSASGNASPEREQSSGEHGFQSLSGFSPSKFINAGASQDFWSDADWLLCRDGKWRPVESASQRMAYGVSLAMDGCLHEVNLDAEASEEIAREALRAMRDGYDPEAIWLTVGGCVGFPAASVLLAILCEHAGKLGEVLDGIAQRGSADWVEGILRAMWIKHGSLAGPPQRRGFSEQLARKLGDALPKLPQKGSYHWNALAMLSGGPLSSGVAGRVGALRGFGNAINPWAAKIFIETFCEVAA